MKYGDDMDQYELFGEIEEYVRAYIKKNVQ
jgi:hypothetical protein